jgi:hypothetical protein
MTLDIYKYESEIKTFTNKEPKIFVHSISTLQLCMIFGLPCCDTFLHCGCMILCQKEAF